MEKIKDYFIKETSGIYYYKIFNSLNFKILLILSALGWTYFDYQNNIKSQVDLLLKTKEKKCLKKENWECLTTQELFKIFNWKG